MSAILGFIVGLGMLWLAFLVISAGVVALTSAFDWLRRP